MKNQILYVALALLSLTFFACGGESQSAGETEAASEIETANDTKYTLTPFTPSQEFADAKIEWTTLQLSAVEFRATIGFDHYFVYVPCRNSRAVPDRTIAKKLNCEHSLSVYGKFGQRIKAECIQVPVKFSAVTVGHEDDRIAFEYAESEEGRVVIWTGSTIYPGELLWSPFIEFQRTQIGSTL